MLRPPFHAYGTNLQFGPDEYDFVKLRAEHSEVPEPE